MGLIELLIVILVLLWFFGYFGPRGFSVRRPAIAAPTWSGDWLHTLLLIALVIIVLRVLRAI